MDPRPAPRRFDPRRAADLELARAVGGLALGPLRLTGFAFERDAIRDGVARDLGAPAPPLDEPPPPPIDRALRLFVSCGETSSERHALRAVRATDDLLAGIGAPPAEWVGLGGPALRDAGVDVRADPTARAAMGGQGVARELGFWRDVLTRAGEGLRGCDAALLVDAPALHVPIARVARRAGVPSVHHVAPQYWGWAPWRARAYRHAVTRPLCILPFERAWFARHGVDARYVGHPQVDHLAELPPPPPPDDPSRVALALLPGSRRHEVAHVLPVMLAAVRAARAELGPAEVLVLQKDDEHADAAAAAIEAAGVDARLVVGEPHDALARSRAALATSGTVLLDLLHHRLPAVALYALRGAARSRLVRWLVTVPHFAVPNLLARDEVLPEVAFPAEDPPDPAELGRLLARCYNDDAWRDERRRGLERAARRLGPPGAARRAAAHLLDVAAGPRPSS